MNNGKARLLGLDLRNHRDDFHASHAFLLIDGPECRIDGIKQEGQANSDCKTGRQTEDDCFEVRDLAWAGT